MDGLNLSFKQQIEIYKHRNGSSVLNIKNRNKECLGFLKVQVENRTNLGAYENLYPFLPWGTLEAVNNEQENDRVSDMSPRRKA
jgi:hypothetical protein